jgi:hypothetical protein
MKIRGQTWIEFDEYLLISLREPLWGAYKTFNWENGVEGIGVAMEALEYARKRGKKVMGRIYVGYEKTKGNVNKSFCGKCYRKEFKINE